MEVLPPPAGQKKYAKSIQRAAQKRANLRNLTGNTFYEDLEEDIGRFTSPGFKKAMDRVRATKKEYDELQKMTSEFSEQENDGLVKRAYDKTLDYFKKHDKRYLNDIIKQNGGDSRTLARFDKFDHEFLKVREQLSDEADRNIERRFLDKGLSAHSVERARLRYKWACKCAAEEILGAYGDLNVKHLSVKPIGSPKGYHYKDVRSYVADSIWTLSIKEGRNKEAFE